MVQPDAVNTAIGEKLKAYIGRLGIDSYKVFYLKWFR